MRVPLLLALLLGVIPPSSALAGEPPAAPWSDPQVNERLREAERLARQGVEQLLQSIETLRDALPQYGAPYFDRNGNIVIPRLDPPAPHAVPVPRPAPDRT